MATANPGASNSDDSDCDLPTPDAKILAPKQEVFIQPYLSNSVHAVRYIKTLKSTSRHGSCWRSTDRSKILLGGWSCITVLNENGQESVYKLLRYLGSVMCGVSITDEKQLLLIDRKYVITVNITPDTPVGSELLAVNTLKVKDPWSVFAISKVEYGILCKGNRIEFFTLKNILMDLNPTNTGFINVDLPRQSEYGDIACGLPDGTICVASWLDSMIYLYDNVGHRFAVIGENREPGDRIQPGCLYCLVSIQNSGDTLVVSCRDGDVHTYKDGVWKLLMKDGKTGGVGNVFRKKRSIFRSICSESMFWAIDYEHSTNVNVYDVSHE